MNRERGLTVTYFLPDVIFVCMVTRVVYVVTKKMTFCGVTKLTVFRWRLSSLLAAFN